MKNLSKKILALIVIVNAILVSSCQNAPAEQGKNPADTAEVSAGGKTADVEAPTERLQPDLPSVNYNGEAFTFLVHEGFSNGYWGSYEIYAEEENGDALNDAVYRRNRAVEEKLNIDIKEVRADDGSTVSFTKKSVTSGDCEYDCVMPRMLHAAPLSSDGYLLAFDQLPHINLANPWWDPNLNGITIGGRLFFAMGDLMLMDKESLFVVMFNKNIAQNSGIENLYNLVRENKWTIDKFYSIAKETAKDLNGDGKLGLDDVAGILSSRAGINFLHFGTGETIVKKDGDDYPYLTMNNERGIRAAEKIVAIFNDTAATVIVEGTSGVSDWPNTMNGMFQNDQGMFLHAQLTYVQRNRVMESDFGILPSPKLDGTQPKYYTLINSIASACIAVPLTVKDRERTSVVLEALSAESKYTLIPAYYDITITNKMIRDEDSAEMLDIIFSSRLFDIGVVFNWGDMWTVPQTLYPNGGNFVSTYEKREPKALQEMGKTIEVFKNLK